MTSHVMNYVLDFAVTLLTVVAYFSGRAVGRIVEREAARERLGTWDPKSPSWYDRWRVEIHKNGDLVRMIHKLGWRLHKSREKVKLLQAKIPKVPVDSQSPS